MPRRRFTERGCLRRLQSVLPASSAVNELRALLSTFETDRRAMVSDRAEFVLQRLQPGFFQAMSGLRTQSMLACESRFALIDPDKSARGGNELSGGVGQTAGFSASGRQLGRAFVRPSLMCIPQAQVEEKLPDAIRVVHSAIDNLKQLDPLLKPADVSAKVLTYLPG